MNNTYIKFIFSIVIVTGWLFSGFSFSFDIPIAEAAVGDIGHWRDSIGSQIPGTTFAAFNFDQEITNENIYTRPNNSTIQLDEAGDYLIISSIRYTDNSKGRFNPQARVGQTSGTGTLFTSYYTGYSRRTSDNESWTRAIGIIIGASASSQIQIQQRRDTDAPTGGSVLGESDVQVVRINPTNYGIYAIGGTTGALGGTTPNLIDITALTSESDTAAIAGNTTTETVTVKGDNKRYLIAWSISGDTGGSRTQRIGHLEYDGVDDLTTRSYCYQRRASDEYCGLGSMDLIETAIADIDIQTEVFRGPGVLADQGGANVDGSFDVDGNGQMVVLELPDSLEVFRSHDATGLQDITAALTFNAIRNVDFNDAASFTKTSNTAMNVINPADVFSWANVWTARNAVAVNARLTAYGSITVNGIQQSTGEHGNYSRGNQSSTDTFAMSFHPAGIFTVGTAGHDIGVNSDPLAGGQTGGTDRTQANTFGFFSLNLDTLLPPAFDQVAYRLFNNLDSTDVGTALAAQDTSAILAAAGDAFRLRMVFHESDAQLRLNEENFKLQFATKSGTCDTSFIGETYADITAATAIAYNNNTTPADAANLTANVNDPTHGAHTIVNQDYEELNNFTNSVAAIPKGQDGKWDFSLIDNSAPSDTSYCFRAVKSDGSTLSSYSVIPEITTYKTPQTLTFSISDNTIGFGTLSTSASRYATGNTLGSGTATTAHSISASTNGTNGYIITVDGTTLTCNTCSGSPTITGIGAAAIAPNTGTEQFGLRATVNTGTGSVSAPYNTANYAFDSAAFPDTVVNGTGDDTSTTFDFEYLANIASNTDGGEYESILSYTITATF